MSVSKDDGRKLKCRDCGLYQEYQDLVQKQYRIDHDLLVGPTSTIVGLAQLMPIAIRELEKRWDSITEKLIAKGRISRKTVEIMEQELDFSLILDASKHMIFTNQVLKEKLAEILNKNVVDDEKAKKKESD